MLTKDMPIGVLDSGVGGLSVLKCLRAVMPAEDFVYIGDTARTPYGTRKGEEVRLFTQQMLDYLERRGVKLVVIACNTITVLGVDSLKLAHPFDIVGMSKGAKLLLAASKKKRIAVMATEFTISTGAHKAAVLAVDASAQVTPIACPKLVPLIEGEAFDAPEMAAAVTEYTDIVKKSGSDALILSCTHYPFLREAIEKALGPEVAVLDPAEETALEAQALLQGKGLLRQEGRGTTEVCFTADIERGRRLAEYMLPQVECNYNLIKL